MLSESQAWVLVKADNVECKQAAETSCLNCAVLNVLPWKLFLSAELEVWGFFLNLCFRQNSLQCD